ncbi:MAG: FUSC family protein [Betaproteobacteria bacterium]
MPNVMTSNIPPPVPYSLDRALLFAIGAGVPVLVALTSGEPRAALFAGMGAVMALQTDPRRSISTRVVSVLVAIGLIIGAGALGVMLQQDHVTMHVIVVFITFLAGLPKPFFPYLTMVGKICAAIVIVTSAGFAATTAAASTFAAGGIFALLVGVLISFWRYNRGTGLTPFGEMRALMSGQRNPLFYAITLAVTVALAMFAADSLHAMLPGWVGLTVLFVMHPDDATALKLITQRIGGTLAGIVLAGIIVHFVHEPWTLAILAISMAAFLPKATAVNYFWMSTVFTTLVMLLLDLALLDKGGDAQLLLWRLYDTVLGCLVAGSVLLVLYGTEGWRQRNADRKRKANDADADPPDAPEASVGDGGVQG